MSLSPSKNDVDIQDQAPSQPVTTAPPIKLGKPPKKAQVTGSKIYVSSKIVDALVQSKVHTDNLAEKRSTLKERLNYLPKSRIIDENKPGILSHSHQSQSTE